MAEEANAVGPAKVLSKRAALTRRSLKEHELEFDKERARAILGILYRQFSSDQKLQNFIETNAPQWKERPDKMEFSSPEHKIWLWSAAATDLRSESEVVYHAHRLLWNNEKNMLALRENGEHRPTRGLYQRDVLGWSREDYTWALSKSRFGNPKRNIEWWGRRADTLWNTWQGDPFRMFENGGVNDLMAWKTKQKQDPLPGVGPKIASLTAIFFEELGMSPVLDAFPVDVHVQRFALALKLIVPKRMGPILNDTLEKMLRREIVALCREEGWSRILLAHAIWFRGNQDCTNCWKTRSVAITCPVFAECQGAYMSRSYFKMGLWLPEDGPMGKGGKRPFIPFEERSLFTGIPQ